MNLAKIYELLMWRDDIFDPNISEPILHLPNWFILTEITIELSLSSCPSYLMGMMFLFSWSWTTCSTWKYPSFLAVITFVIFFENSSIHSILRFCANDFDVEAGSPFNYYIFVVICIPLMFSFLISHLTTISPSFSW